MDSPAAELSSLQPADTVPFLNIRRSGSRKPFSKEKYIAMERLKKEVPSHRVRKPKLTKQNVRSTEELQGMPAAASQDLLFAKWAKDCGMTKSAFDTACRAFFWNDDHEVKTWFRTWRYLHTLIKNPHAGDKSLEADNPLVANIVTMVNAYRADPQVVFFAKEHENTVLAVIRPGVRETFINNVAIAANHPTNTPLLISMFLEFLRNKSKLLETSPALMKPESALERLGVLKPGRRRRRRQKKKKKTQQPSIHPGQK